MTRALVPIADGVEEMEAVVIIDTLRRAQWEVVAAAVRTADRPQDGRFAAPVVASRGVRLLPDGEWSGLDPLRFDVLAIPGGAAGTKTLCADDSVLEAVRQFAKRGRLVGAICAGPLVLQKAGILSGRRATCHPAVRTEFGSAVSLCDTRVAVDGRIVTSQGPGTALEFALTLIELVEGPAAADGVRKGLVM